MPMLCQMCADWVLNYIFRYFVLSEEILRDLIIYLMYGQSAVYEKSICLYLENLIAFQTVIQELRTVCDDGKGSAPAGEISYSKSYTVAA